MSNKSDRKPKWQMLLLIAALLAAVGVIIVIFDLFAQRDMGLARRAHRMEQARVSSTPARASQPQWRRAWTYPAGSSLTDAPAVWSNGWVATTEKGVLVALDEGGRKMWQNLFTNVSFVGSPVVADATIFLAGHNGGVLAVDAASGGVLWRVKIDADLLHGPLLVRHDSAWQVVLLSSTSGELYGLAAQNGQILWQTKPTNESDGQPGADGPYLAYGNCDAAVHIFNSTNGACLAQISVGAGVTGKDGLADMPSGVMAGGVLVRDGLIYGGTGNGELVCVDVAGSNVAWRAKVSEREAFNTPIAVGAQVLMSTRHGDVLAFDARSGVERWRVALSNLVKTLCVADDAVFTVAGGRLVGLRVADGSVFFQAAIGDNVVGPSWNGRILIVADDGGNVIGFQGEQEE